MQYLIEATIALIGAALAFCSAKDTPADFATTSEAYGTSPTSDGSCTPLSCWQKRLEKIFDQICAEQHLLRLSGLQELIEQAKQYSYLVIVLAVAWVILWPPSLVLIVFGLILILVMRFIEITRVQRLSDLHCKLRVSLNRALDDATICESEAQELLARFDPERYQVLYGRMQNNCANNPHSLLPATSDYLGSSMHGYTATRIGQARLLSHPVEALNLLVTGVRLPSAALIARPSNDLLVASVLDPIAGWIAGRCLDQGGCKIGFALVCPHCGTHNGCVASAGVLSRLSWRCSGCELFHAAPLATVNSGNYFDTRSF